MTTALLLKNWKVVVTVIIFAFISTQLYFVSRDRDRWIAKYDDQVKEMTTVKNNNTVLLQAIDEYNRKVANLEFLLGEANVVLQDRENKRQELQEEFNRRLQEFNEKDTELMTCSETIDFMIMHTEDLKW